MIYIAGLLAGLVMFLFVYVIGRMFFTKSVAQERLQKISAANFGSAGISVLKEANDTEEEIPKEAMAAQRALPAKLRGHRFTAFVSFFRIIAICILFYTAYRQLNTGLPAIVFIGLLGSAVFCMVLPSMIRKSYIRKRSEAIEKDLVDVIDLLVVGLEAGLTFQFTLQRIVQRYPNPKPYPLIEELLQTLHELQVGIGLSDCLKRLAIRCDVEDLRMFSSAIVQSEKFGTSLATTMRIYSAELRDKRRQRIRERIAKIPVKITPAMVLFLIALFIVLLGPAVIILMENILGGK